MLRFFAKPCLSFRLLARTPPSTTMGSACMSTSSPFNWAAAPRMSTPDGVKKAKAEMVEVVPPFDETKTQAAVADAAASAR